jgi:hypothetical protein
VTAPGFAWVLALAAVVAAGWAAAAVAIIRTLHRGCCEPTRRLTVVPDGIAAGRADLQLTHQRPCWCGMGDCPDLVKDADA